MKKWFKWLPLVLLIAILSACSSGKVEKESKPKQVATLVVKYGQKGKKDYRNKVTVQKKETVMQVLKKYQKVKESNGFITSIGGVSQNTKEGKYWMYKVNGKLASQSAAKLKVHKGDKITFYRKVYQSQ